MNNKKTKIIIVIIIILILLLGVYFVVKNVNKKEVNNEEENVKIYEESNNEIIESDALENVENDEGENLENVENDEEVPVVVNTATVVRNNTITNNKKNNNTATGGNKVYETPKVPDTEKPNLSVSIARSNGTVKSISVTISATDNRGVDRIMYYVGKRETSNYNTAKGNSKTINFDNNYEDGTYYIWYYAVDTSGNVSDVKKVGPYIIDNTPPRVNQTEISNHIGNIISRDQGNGFVYFQHLYENNYIQEPNIILMYSIVGLNEQHTTFKRADLDELFGEEYVTTESYLAGDYNVYVYLLDSAGNRVDIIRGERVTLR